MELGEVFNALACLVPAALLGWFAIWASRWGTPRPPALPAPAPALIPQPVAAPAVNAPWQPRQQYEPMGDSLKSFLAKDAVPAALPGKTEMHRESPARAAGFVADVLVPLCWALISALFAGGFVGVIAACIAPIAAYWPGAFGASAFLAAGYVWYKRMEDHSKLLWLTEEMVHEDLDHDGNVGKPPQSYSVHIDYTGQRGEVKMDDLPSRTLAHCISSRKLLRSAWRRSARTAPISTAIPARCGASRKRASRTAW